MAGLRDVLFGRNQPVIMTERLLMRLPVMRDHAQWAKLRNQSADFLQKWEPSWAISHFSRRSFRSRVYWANRSHREGRALTLLMFRHGDGVLTGAITLDNIRRGPAQMCNVGYWVGEPHARQGYMYEALNAAVTHAFDEMGLSRIEAACLPDNMPSRGLLEKAGFGFEGIGRNYLKINGTWCDHRLYARVRPDRQCEELHGGIGELEHD